jgi:hypothetical protein
MNIQEIMTAIISRFRSPCGPDHARLKEVQETLSCRPSLSHDEWHQLYAAKEGIPFEFVVWFRETCSRYFEYDLSAALPDDRLMEDLGMCEATWSDVDDYILNAFERWSGIPMPDDVCFYTFGDFLRSLWIHAKSHRMELASDG